MKGTEKAKQKAKELVDKFKKWVEANETECAIECALIAVDEIQNIYMNYVRDGRIEPVSNPTIFEYCEQVRQEIELLKE